MRAGGVFAGHLSEVRVELEGGLPVTTLLFTEVEWAFGGSAATVEVRYLDGTAEGIGVNVSGMPTFEPGFRYLLLIDNEDDPYTPFVAGELGAYQVIHSRHGDSLLVNAPGDVLLVSGTKKVRSVRWFSSDSGGGDVAEAAPDFQHALSESEGLQLAAQWRGLSAPVGAGQTGEVAINDNISVEIP